MPNVPLATIRSAIDTAPTLGDSAKAEVHRQLDNLPLPQNDTWIYRMIVAALGVAIFVPLMDQEHLQMLLPISTAALGALAGLLAPAPH
ncbi:MAG: hypothetical protein JWO25_3380 [Alphaproteobacteria bacterium]|nr:hypothetical protein [Alphaproteobacteria bacterium]